MTEFEINRISAWFPYHMCMFLRKLHAKDYKGAEQELIDETSRLSHVPMNMQVIDGFPRAFWIMLHNWLEPTGALVTLFDNYNPPCWDELHYYGYQLDVVLDLFEDYFHD